MKTTTHPTPDAANCAAATAIKILRNPAPHAKRPAVLLDAWVQLKQARGQTVDVTRLGPTAYLMSEPPSAEVTAINAILARNAGRATEIASQRGLPTKPGRLQPK